MSRIFLVVLSGVVLFSGCHGSIDSPENCGNGRLDSGETCDPPESCPTSCDDSNPCTDDVMTGSARKCNVACSFTPIEECRDGDGCCPAGCDHSSDGDCSALCGNEEIDAGETCDPPSTCPTSCDDRDPCTTDTMTGSAGNCNVECVHADVSVCAGGDGCCPQGCDHLSDPDCENPCGNGKIDEGETCDPPSSCPSSCDDSNPCTRDSMSGSAEECDLECRHEAISECTGGDGCCPPNCDYSSDPDCPPCGPLDERVAVTEIDVSPASVVTSAGSLWSGNRPVILSTLSDGTSRAAWLGSDRQVHITPLTAVDTRSGPDTVIEADEVRGFVAHPDGNAVLVVRGDEMALLRLDSAGSLVFEVSFVGNNDHTQTGDEWISDWMHEGRLAFDGDRYAVYFGLTRNWGPDSGEHQGDMLRFINSDGGDAGGGWSWGCSHSMDVRLWPNPDRFGPVCLSDCYPGKGIYFNHNTLVSVEDGNCLGSTSAELGGMVPVDDGFLLTYASETGRQSYDAAFIPLDADGSPGTEVFLTDTPSVDERNVHLALYGTDLLVFWHEGASHLMAQMDRTGALQGTPVEIQAEAGQCNDMTNFANQDVGWAYAWGDRTRLKIVRVTYCE